MKTALWIIASCAIIFCIGGTSISDINGTLQEIKKELKRLNNNLENKNL